MYFTRLTSPALLLLLLLLLLLQTNPGRAQDRAGTKLRTEHVAA